MADLPPGVVARCAVPEIVDSAQLKDPSGVAELISPGGDDVERELTLQLRGLRRQRRLPGDAQDRHIVPAAFATKWCID